MKEPQKAYNIVLLFGLRQRQAGAPPFSAQAFRFIPMNRRFLLPVLLAITACLCSSWGFFGHQQISRRAVFILPEDMIRFYKNNISFISTHSVDPDKKRYSDPNEGSRHFLDTEHYGPCPFDSIPERWDDAVAKYSEDTLKRYGTVPWQIQKTYYALVKAFEQKDSLRILHLSANISHYIADAHVPLHVTENYNGQMSNQIGIHAFWESRLPELFSSHYNFITGKAHYIENPLKEAWAIVKNTHQYKDEVFETEYELSKSFAPDKKYSYSERSGQILKQYSLAYSKAFHDALHGMVEKQMRSAIAETASFWYSAWVDAGQPDLYGFKHMTTDNKEKQEEEKEEQLFRKGKILGRKDL